MNKEQKEKLKFNLIFLLKISFANIENIPLEWDQKS